ncbi:mothers against decapentaplegic homolog 2 [Monomorium pharaonis]|uniref:mothers against decapentaplegic homolog 2 n=1 Tax=Monomorium pharaonis TaxID=307658 RepID=UPI001746EB56|nr:mothers against decapentaplegic homolog 2 [Monomorium pharaonis]
MLMFWSGLKRAGLTKRLLSKAKVRGEHETECEAQEDSSSRTFHHSTSSSSSNASGAVVAAAAGYDNNNKVTTTTTTTTTTRRRRTTTATTTSGRVAAAVDYAGRRGTASSRLHQGCCGGDTSQDDDELQQLDHGRLLRCKELLKSLKENQLEMLLAAVESYGADLGSCVLVERARHRSDQYPSYCDQQHEHQQQQQQQQQYHGSNSNSSGSRPHRHRHFHQRRYRHYRHHRSTRHHRSSSVEDDQESCCSASEDSSSASSPMRRSAVERGAGDPHLLCCQIWRWPDLEHSSELKRLPMCHSAKDPVYICCNPYHWSRLCRSESPPPPYCLIADRLRPEDRAPSEGDQRRCRNSTPLPLPGSLTTNGEGETAQREWCTLAYWELGGRVGRLYPVEPSTVNVFDSLHDGDGLCLATLAENHIAPPAVQRTRSKIGLGLTLSQEADGVWAYNRSESPIFVNSPTLDDPESRTLLVYRVPPGFCINIFDRAKILQLPYGGGGGQATGFTASGPVDINSVRISFAKGWGPKYSRQEVTSCPCWLEVLLAPCR